MYIQEMTSILALPQGAAEMAPMEVSTLPLLSGLVYVSTSVLGRKGIRCSFTPMGPIPGPPPP